MEMILIILGGILVTAIGFVLMEQPGSGDEDEEARDEVVEDQIGPDDPLLTPELMARLRREFERRHV